jgi:hypothetical protein
MGVLVVFFFVRGWCVVCHDVVVVDGGGEFDPIVWWMVGEVRR